VAWLEVADTVGALLDRDASGGAGVCVWELDTLRDDMLNAQLSGHVDRCLAAGGPHRSSTDKYDCGCNVLQLSVVPSHGIVGNHGITRPPVLT